MGYITLNSLKSELLNNVSKLFRAYGLYNLIDPITKEILNKLGFKALSSLWVI